jgi:hypothetical protein
MPKPITVLLVLDLLNISSPKFIEPVIRLNGRNLKIFKGFSAFCWAMLANEPNVKIASRKFFIFLLLLRKSKFRSITFE